MFSNTGIRLKSVVIVPKRFNTSKVLDEKDYELVQFKNTSESKQKSQVSSSVTGDDEFRRIFV